MTFIFCVFAFYSQRKKVTIEKLKAKPRGLERLLIPAEIVKHCITIVFGIGGILAFSKLLIDSSVEIAEFAGIPKIVIGATVIAIGTSLPELATTLTSLKEKHVNLALGNVIGSCLTNLSLVLGLMFILSPFKVDFLIFSEMVSFVLFSTILLWVFLGSLGRKRLDRMEGMILIFVYIFFMITTFSVQISRIS